MSQEPVRREPRPRYALAVKEGAVLRAEAGERVSAIAAELGCRPNRIYRWLSEWREHGGEWPAQRRRRRRRGMPAAGSTEREAELERLVGQKQAELDFFQEALRLIEQAHRPTVGAGGPSPGGSSRPGRLNRKAR
jgi:transposase-like protein